jgi:hypothetical protein
MTLRTGFLMTFENLYVVLCAKLCAKNSKEVKNFFLLTAYSITLI